MKFSTDVVKYEWMMYIIHYIYEWELLKSHVFQWSLLSELWVNSLALILIQFLSLSKRLVCLLFNILNYIT